MRHIKRLILAFIMFLSGTTAAFAAGATGTGAFTTTLYGQYNTAPLTLTQGQFAPLQLDASGNVKLAPAALIQGSPLQTYSASGVGADTAFPSSVSTIGTSLGTLPTGASKLLLHLPPGASVSYYVANVVASSSAGAVLVSSTYANPSDAISSLEIAIDLDGEQVWITHYVSGTATTYTSGAPVYRFL